MAQQQVTTGSVLAKIKGSLVKAHEAAKNKTTLPKVGGELPGGVNGVAKLVECRLGVVEKDGPMKGKPYFYAAGVVVAPQNHKDGTPIANLRTSIIEMLCDTPPKPGTAPSKDGRYTVADHVDWVYEQLRGLGVDTKSLTLDNMEATFAALLKAGVHFRFHTWQPPAAETGPYAGKEQKVKHFWDGAVKFTPAPSTPAMTEHPAPANGAASSASTATATAPTAPVKKSAPGPKKAAPAPTPTPPPAPAEGPADEPTFDDGALDYDALAEVAGREEADDDVEAARVKLSEVAFDLGITEQQIESASDWSEVVALIRAAESGEGGDKVDEISEDDVTGGEGGDEGGPTYKEGETVRYGPVNIRTRKPGKPIDVKVLSCDDEKQTLDLLNLADRKTKYLKVPFTNILPLDE